MEHKQSKKTPLVSCVMPTRNRRDFILQSIKYFERQDYPNKELIILDNGEDKIKDLVPNVKNIHYFHFDIGKMTFGDLRNLSIKNSNGEIITSWDDDDWYGNNRITKQVQPIIEKLADFTCMSRTCFFNIKTDEFWVWVQKTKNAKQYGLIDSLVFPEPIDSLVFTGTISFRKDIWEKYVKYESIHYGEDSKFIEDFFKESFKMKIIESKNNFIRILRSQSNEQF